MPLPQTGSASRTSCACLLSQVLGWYQLSPGRAGILWFVVLTYKLGMLGSVSDQLPACLWAVGLGLMGCVFRMGAACEGLGHASSRCVLGARCPSPTW